MSFPELNFRSSTAQFVFPPNTRVELSTRTKSLISGRAADAFRVVANSNPAPETLVPLVSLCGSGSQRQAAVQVQLAWGRFQEEDLASARELCMSILYMPEMISLQLRIAALTILIRVWQRDFSPFQERRALLEQGCLAARNWPSPARAVILDELVFAYQNEGAYQLALDTAREFKTLIAPFATEFDPFLCVRIFGRPFCASSVFEDLSNAKTDLSGTVHLLFCFYCLPIYRALTLSIVLQQRGSSQ